ncbi:MAG: hypothetical protein IJ568_02450 [Bacilli bacterium]|nr:hypothetical protein [Bacilli bacterium]
MIFNNSVGNFNNFKENSYKSSIDTLKKSQAILDERLSKKQISNDEYIEKSKKIKEKLDEYNRILEKNY